MSSKKLVLRVAAVSAATLVGGALVASSASASGTSVYHGMKARGVKATHGHGGGGGSSDLLSHGGSVMTSPRVFIVYWGSQWSASGGPSGDAVAQRQLAFFSHLGGSGDTWSGSTTQYCQGVPSGATNCALYSGVTYAGKPATDAAVAGTWWDNAAAAPSRPTQSQLAAEAVAAAGQSKLGNAVQYVIDTYSGNNASGFGTQYCAWHSSTASSYGTLSYTNMPYVTDAGASCGANFVNSGNAGLLDGVTIVGGHEYAESVSDPFPNTGWLDGSGSENGDKCAWVSPGALGGAANVSLNGLSFPVQALWSNSLNDKSPSSQYSGCAIYFVSNSNQHG